MKYLITGISGFVGQHLTDHLLAQGHEVAGVDLHPMVVVGEGGKKVSFYQASLMDLDALRGLLDVTAPQRIIHLASASSVALSWERPVECFSNNTNIFLNLIEAVRLSGVKCRILSVGSSEEYGPVTDRAVPLDESCPLNPMNPYAVARVAQEQLSRVFVSGYGLNIICTRSFNHVGPGQSDRFVVSSFVRQAFEVYRGQRESVLCGDLNIVRDFIDVRDVVRAYEHILDHGVSGDIYNVCSGRGSSLSDILQSICDKVHIGPQWKVLKDLIRPIDNPVIIGNGEKLRKSGFRVSYDLDRSLDDMVQWWRERGADDGMLSIDGQSHPPALEP
jgi:GDP-4-dehydro-6-deoxy-D-mannose reductase